MPDAFVIRYAPPPAGVGDRISSLYDFRGTDTHYDLVERADRPQLRIQLSGEGHYHFANGEVYPVFLATLLGPTSGPVRGVGTGPTAVVGAGLLPPAWVMLMGSEAEHHIDRAIDAAQIFGDALVDLRATLLTLDDPDQRMAALAAFLADALVPGDSAPFQFTAHVDAWLASSLNPQVDDLIAHTGLGLRQLERMTKRYYGLPPKTLARKYRALRAASALARGEALSDTDLGDAFYDQSHLIREVKRFAGFTPTQIQREHADLTNAIAQGRKTLTGQVGPLVSDA
jgi:AraC-like DNA-binding protein